MEGTGEGTQQATPVNLSIFFLFLHFIAFHQYFSVNTAGTARRRSKTRRTLPGYEFLSIPGRVAGEMLLSQYNQQLVCIIIFVETRLRDGTRIAPKFALPKQHTIKLEEKYNITIILIKERINE